MPNDFSGVDQTPENQESDDGKTQKPEDRSVFTKNGREK